MTMIFTEENSNQTVVTLIALVMEDISDWDGNS